MLKIASAVVAAGLLTGLPVSSQAAPAADAPRFENPARVQTVQYYGYYRPGYYGYYRPGWHPWHHPHYGYWHAWGWHPHHWWYHHPGYYHYYRY
jgi:hypothetical protein